MRIHLSKVKHCNIHLAVCRGTAVTMKKMLETQFPGIEVLLANYPPSLPKRLLAKLVPVVQIGVIGIVMAGEQIFPVLGIMTPPPWYYSLRANKFGTMASTWLLGNALQSFLQSSGAFEVYCNDELVGDLYVGIHPFNFLLLYIFIVGLYETLLVWSFCGTVVLFCSSLCKLIAFLLSQFWLYYCLW